MTGVQTCALPISWTAAHQASMSFTVSRSLHKFMSIESVMPSNHFIFCRPFLLQFSSAQLLSHVRLFATPWTAASQASLSITNFGNLLKFMSIESVMPSKHLIICHPFLLPPSIFPSIRVFSNESVLHIRWPKYCSFSFSILPMNTQD